MPKPIAIAVIHLPNLRRIALEKKVDDLISYVENEVRTISEAGFDGIIIENFNDRPYSKRVQNPEILGLVSIALYTARKSFNGLLGLSLLRCSAVEAYRIAYTMGADFIRVNTFVETIATDSGLIEPTAPELAELRMLMPGVKIFADVLCKHSGSLDLLLRFVTNYVASHGDLVKILKETVSEIVKDLTERGCADAVIVTGGRTGEPPSLDLVKLVRESTSIPIIVGSGMTPDNIDKYLKYADGVIIGNYIKKDGRAGNPTDPERARKFMEKIKKLREFS